MTNKVSLQVEGHRQTASGITATVVGHLDSKQIFRDRVNLDSVKSRAVFTKGLIKALENAGGKQMPPVGKRKITELVENQLSAEAARPQVQNQNSLQIQLLENVSLASVHAALQEIVSSPYTGDVVELAVAAVINAARTEDAPSWLTVIGEPSTGKTQTVEGIRYEPSVYFLDTLTDKAFISGFVNPDGTSPTDLLAELQGKCFLIKDLTPLFSGREEITKSVLGQMVSIYDGSFARKTGTRERIEYRVRFSFLACITPKGIERHHRYIQEMGSRLLFYRMSPLTKSEEDEGLNRVLDNGKHTKTEKYKLLCSSYAHTLLKDASPQIKLTNKQQETLKSMAKLLARGRAVMDWDDGEKQMEGPFRILSQLRSLVSALALVHGRSEVTEHEMEIMRRVVFSTISKNRALVLSLFQNPAHLTPEGELTVKVAVKAGLNPSTAKSRLETLVSLEILEVDTSQKEHKFKPLAEFADIVSKPIEPLDHIADAALSPSHNKLPTGVSKTSNGSSCIENPMDQVNSSGEVADD